MTYESKPVYSFPLRRLGIIGGGQLGKMLVQKARTMGFYTETLDNSAISPASGISDKHYTGSLYDTEKLENLVKGNDVTTFEIEHVGVDVLKRLERAGYSIFPSPEVLEIIQDKYVQKSTLDRAGIPVPKYVEAPHPSAEVLSAFGFPLVQKAKKGGYDGRGVAVLRNQSDLGKLLQVPSMLEELVDIEKELAVIVARSIKGEVVTFPVVEMVFDERVNICDTVLAPARITQQQEAEICRIAIRCVEVLNAVGVVAIEFFLSRNGQILVNEIAPRPHNSGHFSIEACLTSQFEQHIRAVFGLPLGATNLHSTAIMVNMLGEPGFDGDPVIEGFNETLAVEGASFHWYGKSETKPFRKMGHVTILATDHASALEKALKVKNLIKIKGRNKI
ncbi:MAG TPA: 5-(carboxyamino)imidazole ribonucleotide synthase [Bacteroidales bacterium]|nr:5-(carboxyamino)imidazole ribonucleotide synthase [Bacteroidales bacterium]